MAHRGARARRRADWRAEEPAAAHRIGLHIVRGGSLRTAAVALPDAPSRNTLYRWKRDRPAFARAVEMAEDLRDWLAAERAWTMAEPGTPARKRRPPAAGRRTA